jgi:hypothetical protein
MPDFYYFLLFDLAAMGTLIFLYYIGRVLLYLLNRRANKRARGKKYKVSWNAQN